MNVAVIGASDRQDRYAYKALKLLQENGHHVYPVHQRIKTIEGLPVFASIKDVPDAIHTVTLYVSADVSDKLAADIIGCKPKRIIFNPGAENAQLEATAQSNGIITVDDCTLVMLRAGTFNA